ncbi:hypothetical protein NBRC116589_43670 [Ruegeria sp. HU-ET01832]
MPVFNKIRCPPHLPQRTAPDRARVQHRDIVVGLLIEKTTLYYGFPKFDNAYFAFRAYYTGL